MPVFHTKTIQAILEPVANQVSQLVLLHEYSEGGQNPIPDLSIPIHGVSKAVENLVAVGRETTATSKDPVLQQEMPLALDRVSEASSMLLETSRLLKQDPYSADARRKLIDGSRGILQGTSTLLLVSDQAEVRKILRTCKAVYECLAIAEVIETLDDLIVYVKNMTPGLTQMTREVENRRTDLSHHVHSDLLQKALDKVKSYTPMVISSIKTYVATLQSGQGRAEAIETRNYVISKVMEAIQEMMRVLQLTSYDEDEWESDELTMTKRLKYQLEENRAAAMEWLNNPQADSGALGQVLLRQSLDDAQKMAERCPDANERARMLAHIGTMDTMLKQLNQLRRQGLGRSPEAMKLTDSLSEAFDQLIHDIARNVDNMERSGATRPAHTVLGKVEQAQRWLANPYAKDGDTGEQAARLVIAEGRRVADITPNQQLKSHLFRICDDVESLTNRLADLRRSGRANDPEARGIAHDLSRKLDALKCMIQDGVIWQVADCFADTLTPIRLLHQAATLPTSNPNREQIFQQRALDFIQHANNVINVSKKVASTNTGNKQYSEDISALAVQLQDATPQVVHSAKIVLTYPSDQAVGEHFELLKKEWTSTLEQLSGLIDEVIDTGTFIKASEAGMLHHAERAETALNQYNIPDFSSNTSQIVRRADRVARVADGDAASSDDPQFVERVGAAVQLLRTHLSPVVVSAKEAAVNPQEKAAVSRWKNSNQALITAVGKVHHAILVVPEGQQRGRYDDLNSSGSPLPDLAHMSINSAASPPPDYDSLARHLRSALEEQGPPRPPLPADGGAPPRPPPPAETDDEDESFSFPAPQANQPIMMAAHELHLEAKQWSSKDNELIAAAKRMAKLMARLSQLVRGEDGGSKIELIDTAKAIAIASDEVASLATKLAKEITDRRMRNALLQVCERIPTIGTQLKVLTTVKATMLGAQGSEEDQEATEMLVGNAQNLMQSVRETVRAAEAASIKMRIDSGYSIRWLRKRPWYT